MNRDELGDLAANVNRMNDELRRVRGARGGKPSQVGVPSQHVARAPHAAERDPGVLAGPPRGDVRPREPKSAEYLEDILASGHHLLS